MMGPNDFPRSARRAGTTPADIADTARGHKCKMRCVCFWPEADIAVVLTDTAARAVRDQKNHVSAMVTRNVRATIRATDQLDRAWAEEDDPLPLDGDQPRVTRRAGDPVR